MSLERYSNLLTQFQQISQTYVRGDVLEELKKRYEKEINSKRTFETVIDIRTLLKVLEKRGILQYDDVNVLKEIAAQFVKDESVQQLISDYVVWQKKNASGLNNLYSCAIVPKADKIPQTLETPGSNMPSFTSNFNVGISVEPRFIVNQTLLSPAATHTAPLPDEHNERQLKILIVQTVGRWIGKFWRDVCRILNVDESDIEEIETKYSTEEHGNEKMFKEAMEIYFSENRRNWKTEIMRALELSRRKDLREKVETLINENYLAYH